MKQNQSAPTTIEVEKAQSKQLIIDVLRNRGTRVAAALALSVDPNLVRSDDHQTGNKNCTALYFAVKNKNYPMIALLQKHGAIYDYEESASAVQSTVQQGSTSTLGQVLRSFVEKFSLFSNQADDAAGVQNKAEDTTQFTNS